MALMSHLNNNNSVSRGDNLPYCALDLHVAGNQQAHGLAATDGVCQPSTCTLCFHWAIELIESRCCRDQCTIWLCGVCIIHWNAYLWAIIFRASLDPSHSIFQWTGADAELWRDETGPLQRKPVLPLCSVKTLPPRRLNERVKQHPPYEASLVKECWRWEKRIGGDRRIGFNKGEQSSPVITG